MKFYSLLRFFGNDNSIKWCTQTIVSCVAESKSNRLPHLKELSYSYSRLLKLFYWNDFKPQDCLEQVIKILIFWRLVLVFPCGIRFLSPLMALYFSWRLLLFDWEAGVPVCGLVYPHRQLFFLLFFFPKSKSRRL